MTDNEDEALKPTRAQMEPADSGRHSWTTGAASDCTSDEPKPDYQIADSVPSKDCNTANVRVTAVGSIDDRVETR